MNLNTDHQTIAQTQVSCVQADLEDKAVAASDSLVVGSPRRLHRLQNMLAFYNSTLDIDLFRPLFCSQLSLYCTAMLFSV